MSKQPAQFLICWDFPARAKSTFYDILAQEFGRAHLRLLQQSVYLVRDAETARELRALAKWYGASRVEAFALDGLLRDDAAADRLAEARIADLHAERLKRRGRKPTKWKGRKK